MPSTGAMSKIAGSASGTLSPYTELGPPLRMMPVGCQSRIHSTVRLGGWISEDTPPPAHPRPINCVNCEPKPTLMERPEAERRAVIAGVHHHAHAAGGETLQDIRNRRNPIVGIRHHADSHAVRHAGGSSLRTRSS